MLSAGFAVCGGVLRAPLDWCLVFDGIYYERGNSSYCTPLILVQFVVSGSSLEDVHAALEKGMSAAASDYERHGDEYEVLFYTPGCKWLDRATFTVQQSDGDVVIKVQCSRRHQYCPSLNLSQATSSSTSFCPSWCGFCRTCCSCYQCVLRGGIDIGNVDNAFNLTAEGCLIQETGCMGTGARTPSTFGR